MAEVLCLLMPFFVPASATELQDVALLFLVHLPHLTEFLLVLA